MARFEFWVHGLNLQFHWYNTENMPAGKSRNLQIARRGPYTTVTQEPGTDNYFGFAIPTPSIIDDRPMILGGLAWIEATIDKNAVIDQVDIWDGDELVVTLKNHTWFGGGRQRINLTGIPEKRIKTGIAIFIHVSFLAGIRSSVDFHSVGIRFDKI